MAITRREATEDGIIRRRLFRVQVVACLREFEDLRAIPRVIHAYCREIVVGGNNPDAVVAEFAWDWGTQTCYYLDALHTCHEGGSTCRRELL